MKHDSITKEGQELAALYSLGALSQHEAREFDVHLKESCPVCEAELKQFEHIVGELGSAAPPVAPPAFLRDLLTARIQREIPDEATSPASVIPFGERQRASESRFAPAPSSMSRVWLPWAVAAMLLIALAYTFTTWRSERRALQAAIERESQTTTEQSTELKEQLEKLSAKTSELEQVNSVLSSPQWRIIPLNGLDPAPQSSARIYWDLQGKRWVVTADLPPPPEGKVYQLWFVTPEAKISAGLIRPDETGHGFTVVQLPPNIDQLAAAAITLEPEGGSPQPTMPIYALGKAA